MHSLLTLWGWHPELYPGTDPATLGRVSEEQRGMYMIETAVGSLAAHCPGKFRLEAESRLDFPVVGDWVVFTRLPGEAKALIHAVLPRRTLLARKEAGGEDAQPIGANLDAVFLVTSLNQDLNPRRIERFLTLVYESGAEPVVVLSKADLTADPWSALGRAERVAPGVKVLAVSAATGDGLAEFAAWLKPGSTVAFVGSSGVGKSTLLNALLGREAQKTLAIREDDGKGRHTTTSRKLFTLPGGALVLDSPGIREVGLLAAPEAELGGAFPEIAALAGDCRFRDCRHETEPDCAVQAALESGELPADRWRSYQKLLREQAFLARKGSKALEAEEKKKWKNRNKELRQRTKEKRY